MQRKVFIFIATSLDGYIAKENDDISFLDMVAEEGQDYGYETFINTVDNIILGRKTYDKVQNLGFSYKGRKTYVITRTERPSIDNVEFYTGDLKELLIQLKKENGKNIFVDGGAEIVNEIMKHQLIDEYVISIIPVFLGSGVRLFKDGRPESKLKLIDAKSFDKGLVQLHYVTER